MRGVSNLSHVVRSLEWPMAILALLIIPALVLEERALSPGLRTAGAVLNWVTWLGFCAEFLVRWAADRRASFPRRAWFDLLLILLTPPSAYRPQCGGFEASGSCGSSGCFAGSVLR